MVNSHNTSKFIGIKEAVINRYASFIPVFSLFNIKITKNISIFDGWISRKTKLILKDEAHN